MPLYGSWSSSSSGLFAGLSACWTALSSSWRAAEDVPDWICAPARWLIVTTSSLATLRPKGNGKSWFVRRSRTMIPSRCQLPLPPSAEYLTEMCDRGPTSFPLMMNRSFCPRSNTSCSDGFRSSTKGPALPRCPWSCRWTLPWLPASGLFPVKVMTLYLICASAKLAYRVRFNLPSSLSLLSHLRQGNTHSTLPAATTTRSRYHPASKPAAKLLLLSCETVRDSISPKSNSVMVNVSTCPLLKFTSPSFLSCVLLLSALVPCSWMKTDAVVSAPAWLPVQILTVYFTRLRGPACP
mmetsp:Transcript_7637/g.17410  ORF Transcript_7637/g.17410 Transcript_7637/m.17410 type:complete len:295 (-) Transcript_7637:68-952(-)